MTTDTKAVARWDVETMDERTSSEGRWVLFTDHAQVVSELKNYQRITDQVLIGSQQMVMSLRSALAAKTAEVERLLGALKVAELALRERGLRACAEYKEIESALAKAMEKSNEHQDQ